VCAAFATRFVKEVNIAFILNHIDEEQRGGRRTGCQEKHFSL